MAGGAIRMVQMVGARFRAGSERTSVRDASREVRATPQMSHYDTPPIMIRPLR